MGVSSWSDTHSSFGNLGAKGSLILLGDLFRADSLCQLGDLAELDTLVSTGDLVGRAHLVMSAIYATWRSLIKAYFDVP